MLTQPQTAGVAIAGLLILWQCWPAIAAIGQAIKNAWPPPQPPALEAATRAIAAEPVDDEDAADFRAIGRLQRRFERLNCDEGREAIKTCLTCFYDRSEA